MTVVLTLLHVIVAVFLILVVLLQTGKGAEMGAAFGGASQTLFGGGGPAGFLARLTTVAAVVFMVTSLGLAYLSSSAARGPASGLPSSAPVSPVPVTPSPLADQTTAPAEGAGAAGATAR